MCRENRELFIILFFGLLLSFAVGVLRAGEPSGWYLISETELLSIERYKVNSEAEKQSWLLQAQESRRDSEILNNQLSQAREQNRRLEQFFNEYEKDRLTLLSSKNGEIAELNRVLAAERLEKEKYRGVSRTRLVVIIALAGSWVLFLALRLYGGRRIF